MTKTKEARLIGMGIGGENWRRGVLALADKNIGKGANRVEISKEYERLNLLFEAEFSKIFERTVADEEIRAPLDKDISGERERVEAILSAHDLLDQLYLLTDGMRPNEALSIYSEKLSLPGRSLADLVERVYMDIYD